MVNQKGKGKVGKLLKSLDILNIARDIKDDTTKQYQEGIEKTIVDKELVAKKEKDGRRNTWISFAINQSIRYKGKEAAENMFDFVECTLERESTLSKVKTQKFIERMNYDLGHWLDMLSDNSSVNEEILRKLDSNIELITWLAQHPGIFYVLHLYSTVKFEPIRKFIESYLGTLLKDPCYKSYYDSTKDYPEYNSNIPSGNMGANYYRKCQEDIMNALESQGARTLPAMCMVVLFDTIEKNDFGILKELAEITTCTAAELELYIVMIDFVDYLIDHTDQTEPQQDINKTRRELYHGVFNEAISDFNPAKKAWMDKKCTFIEARLKEELKEKFKEEFKTKYGEKWEAKLDEEIEKKFKEEWVTRPERYIDTYIDNSLEDSEDKWDDEFDESIRDEIMSLAENYDEYEDEDWDDEFTRDEIIPLYEKNDEYVDWADMTFTKPIAKEVVDAIYPDNSFLPMKLETDEPGIDFYPVNINKDYFELFLKQDFERFLKQDNQKNMSKFD